MMGILRIRKNGSLRFLMKEYMMGLCYLLREYGVDDGRSRIARNPTTMNGDYAELTKYDDKYYVSFYVGDEVYDFDVSSKSELNVILDRY